MVIDGRDRADTQRASPPPAASSFWREWLTPQMLITIICFVFAAGGYWQTLQDLRGRVASVEDRMAKMEDMNRETYMRRDVLAEQLSKIEGKIDSMNKEVENVKIEVRKIR